MGAVCTRRNQFLAQSNPNLQYGRKLSIRMDEWMRDMPNRGDLVINPGEPLQDFQEEADCTADLYQSTKNGN